MCVAIIAGDSTNSATEITVIVVCTLVLIMLIIGAVFYFRSDRVSTTTNSCRELRLIVFSQPHYSDKTRLEWNLFSVSIKLLHIDIKCCCVSHSIQITYLWLSNWLFLWVFKIKWEYCTTLVLTKSKAIWKSINS
jgi:hypothetical protein